MRPLGRLIAVEAKFRGGDRYFNERVLRVLGPTYRLDVPQSNMDDLNMREYLEKINIELF